MNRLSEALLDPVYDREGTSILGGEPMAQPEGLLALVGFLQAQGCAHLLVYSGYTYEQHRRVATRIVAIQGVLDAIDILVDGPYVQARARDPGPWTGSANQRVIDLSATRWSGCSV